MVVLVLALKIEEDEPIDPELVKCMMRYQSRAAQEELKRMKAWC